MLQERTSANVGFNEIGPMVSGSSSASCLTSFRLLGFHSVDLVTRFGSLASSASFSDEIRFFDFLHVVSSGRRISVLILWAYPMQNSGPPYLPFNWTAPWSLPRRRPYSKTLARTCPLPVHQCQVDLTKTWVTFDLCLAFVLFLIFIAGGSPRAAEWLAWTSSGPLDTRLTPDTHFDPAQAVAGFPFWGRNPVQCANWMIWWSTTDGNSPLSPNQARKLNRSSAGLNKVTSWCLMWSPRYTILEAELQVQLRSESLEMLLIRSQNGK